MFAATLLCSPLAWSQDRPDDAANPAGRAAACAAILARAASDAEQDFVAAYKGNPRDPHLEFRMKAAFDLGMRARALERVSSADRMASAVGDGKPVESRGRASEHALGRGWEGFDRSVSNCLALHESERAKGVITPKLEAVCANEMRSRLKRVVHTLGAR